MILSHQHFDLLQKIVLERVVFNPPLKANGSMHNEACFLYAVNGESRLYSALSQEDLKRNQGVIMKCGNYLNSWKENQSEEPSEAVAVHFHPEVLRHVYGSDIPEFLKKDKPEESVSIQSIEVSEMLGKYVESLLFYFNNPSLVNDELLVLKVKELILLLVNTDSSNRIRSILQDLFNPEEFEFKDIIHAHLYEDLSLDDMAVLCNLSLSSFKRKFKQVFDDTPAHYIKGKRLEHAAEQLVLGNKRISDICYECGFNELAHFSRSFAEKYGLSPSEYRQKRA